ncbi:MAG: protein kinase, partial [Myxococcota bacterium]
MTQTPPEADQEQGQPPPQEGEGLVVQLPNAGDWVAGFQIIRPLGQGGFGTVYEARQQSMGQRRVALKILAPRNVHEPNAVERFRQEALLASRLSHPNTITLFDFGATEDGLFYIAMEYLEGEPLSDVLFNQGAMSLERVENITRQLLQSLAEAHSIGLIHRDLKPDNIFLCPIFGNPNFVKVLDFGLAKMAGMLEENSPSQSLQGARPDLTLEGRICGTPEYMAPEQAQGFEPLTPACDVYAVGLLIFYMLTARRPFVGQNAVEVLQQQIHSALPELPPDLRSTRLGRLMEVAVRKSPDARYPDASAMLYAMAGKLPIDPLSKPQEEEVRQATTRSESEKTGHFDISKFVAHTQREGEAVPLPEPDATFEVEINLKGRRRPSNSIEKKDRRLIEHPTLFLENAVGALSNLIDEEENDRTIDGVLVADSTGAIPVFTHETPDDETEADAEAVRDALDLSDRQLPLLGRDRDLRRVIEAVTVPGPQVMSRRIVLVEGDAGVGKSRLLAEAWSRLQDRGGITLAATYFRDPQASAIPGLRTVWTRLFGLAEADLSTPHDDDKLREGLSRSLKRMGASLVREDLNLLHRLLHPNTDHIHQLGQPVQGLVGLISRLVQIALELGRRLPLLLITEDIQYADPASLEFLRRLALTLGRSGPGVRLALLMSLRTEDRDKPGLSMLLSPLQALGEPWFKRIDVEPLSDDGGEALIAQLIPVHPELRRRIAQTAHGNPLHTIQLVRHLLQDGRLHKVGGAWQLTNEQQQLSLPHDLSDMVRLRVTHAIEQSSAPEAMQELLYRLAVLGRRVPRELLQIALDLEERPWPESLLDRLLSELMGRHIIRNGSEQGRITFEHGILHEVLLREAEASLAGPRLHRTAANAKEAYFANAHPIAQELAEHYLKGRSPTQALPWLTTAAERLEQLGDFDGALERYQTADDLVATLIRQNDPRAFALGGPVWLAIGRLSDRAGRLNEARAFLQRITSQHELYEEYNPLLALRADLLLGRIARDRGASTEARTLLQRSARAAHRMGQTEEQVKALTWIGELAMIDGSGLREGYLASFENFMDRLHDPSSSALARCRRHVALVRMHNNQELDRAEVLLTQAMADAHEDHALRALIIADLGLCSSQQGRLTEAELHLDRARASFDALGLPMGQALTLQRLATVIMAQVPDDSSANSSVLAEA